CRKQRSVEFLEHPSHQGHQFETERRRRHMPRRSFEERCTDRGLELLNAPAQRRLRQMQRIGCAVETFQFDHREKGPQIKDFTINAHYALVTSNFAFYYIIAGGHKFQEKDLGSNAGGHFPFNFHVYVCIHMNADLSWEGNMIDLTRRRLLAAGSA